MIDYIKVAISSKYASEVKERVLMIETKCDPDTQEVITETGKLENMEVLFTKSSLIITGSLHIFYNLVFMGQDQNYNDFSLDSIGIALDTLEHRLGVSLSQAKLQNLEFGVNIQMDSDVDELIKQKLISYRFQGPSIDIDYGIEGRIKEFTTSQYYLKIYDKGRKYHLDVDLLRVEIKYKRSTLLKSLGISFLSDIFSPANLKALCNDYLDRLGTDLLVVDSVNFETVDDAKQREVLKDGISPLFWAAFPKTLSRSNGSSTPISYSTRRRRKLEFRRLLKELGLTTLKEEIMTKLELKLIELSGLDSVK